jgi:hypothetical protein
MDTVASRTFTGFRIFHSPLEKRKKSEMLILTWSADSLIWIAYVCSAPPPPLPACPAPPPPPLACPAPLAPFSPPPQISCTTQILFIHHIMNSSKYKVVSCNNLK